MRIVSNDRTRIKIIPFHRRRDCIRILSYVFGINGRFGIPIKLNTVLRIISGERRENAFVEIADIRNNITRIIIAIIIWVIFKSRSRLRLILVIALHFRMIHFRNKLCKNNGTVKSYIFYGAVVFTA